MTLALMKLSLSRLMWMKFDPAVRAFITMSHWRLRFARNAVRSLLLLLLFTPHALPGFNRRGSTSPIECRSAHSRAYMPDEIGVSCTTMFGEQFFVSRQFTCSDLCP